MHKYKTEKDLAAAFIKWLEAQGYEIFNEVSCDTGRADIVAKDSDGKIHILETKLTFNLSLIEQMVLHSYDPEVTGTDLRHPFSAQMRPCCANYVWAVTSLTYIRGWKYNKKREIAVYLCSRLKVGLIIATTLDHFKIALQPVLREPVDLLEVYHGHKLMGEPGSNQGEYWTEFKQLNLELLQFVQEHPGCTLKEAAPVYLKFRPNTRQPARCINGGIAHGYMKGMKLEKEKNKLRIYLTDDGLHYIKMYGKI